MGHSFIRGRIPVRDGFTGGAGRVGEGRVGGTDEEVWAADGTETREISWIMWAAMRPTGPALHCAERGLRAAYLSR